MRKEYTIHIEAAIILDRPAHVRFDILSKRFICPINKVLIELVSQMDSRGVLSSLLYQIIISLVFS